MQEIQSYRHIFTPLKLRGVTLKNRLGFSPMVCNQCTIDGTVTDAMVLATGAAVSPNLNQLISRTRFVCRLIALDEAAPALRDLLGPLPNGLWAIDDDNNVHDLHLSSVFLLDKAGTDLFAFGNTLFAAGAVSDRLLKHLTAQKQIASTRLIIRDFTKLFVSPEVFNDFRRHGGTLQVLQRSHLLAVCLNPTSPQGYTLNSADACAALSDALQLPVYDVMQPEIAHHSS